MTTSLFEIHFGTPEQFLAELAADVEDDAVTGNIVRLAIVSGQPPGGVFGMDRAKSWYVEASYTSTRNQLVKVSIGCGWFGAPGSQFVNADENEGDVKNRLRQISHKLEAGIRLHPAIRLRGGSLREGDGAWSIGEADIEDVPAEICASCQEPIYFANEAWRHEGSKQAEAYDNASCDPCRGRGRALGGRRPRTASPSAASPGSLCPECHGTGAIRTLNHLADPAFEERKV